MRKLLAYIFGLVPRKGVLLFFFCDASFINYAVKYVRLKRSTLFDLTD